MVNIVLRFLHTRLKSMSLWGLFSLAAVLGQFQKSPWVPKKAVEVNSTIGIQAELSHHFLPQTCPAWGHNCTAACSESKGHSSEESRTKEQLLQCYFSVNSEICSREHQISPKLGKCRGEGMDGFSQYYLISSFQQKRKMLLLPPHNVKGVRGISEVTPSCQYLEHTMGTLTKTSCRCASEGWKCCTFQATKNKWLNLEMCSPNPQDWFYA